MKLVIAATLCHMIPGISAPVCHEEIALRTDDGNIQMCNFAQAIIADWARHHPKFGQLDDNGNPLWTVGSPDKRGYKCVFGSYEPKDEM